MSSLAEWNLAVSRAKAEGFNGVPRKGSKLHRRAMELLQTGIAEAIDLYTPGSRQDDDEDGFFTPQKSPSIFHSSQVSRPSYISPELDPPTDDEDEPRTLFDTLRPDLDPPTDDESDISLISDDDDEDFADVLGSMPRALRNEYLKHFGPRFVRTPAKAAELLEALAEDKPVYRRRGPLMFPTVIRRGPRIKVSK